MEMMFGPNQKPPYESHSGPWGTLAIIPIGMSIIQRILDMASEFLESPVAWVVGGIVGLLVLLTLIQKALGMFRGVKSASASQKMGFLPRVAYRHAAKKALQEEAYLRAADFYYSAGDFLESAEAHLKGRNYVRAGEIFAVQKKFKRAAEAFEKGGDPLRAAQLFASFGKLDRAEDNYLKAGKLLAIAEMYQQAMEYNRAGEYFEKMNRYRQAAEMFARGNNYGAAARMLDRLCQGGAKAGKELYQEREIQNFAGRAADLYIKNQEPDKAASLLERLEMWRPAADILLQSHSYKDAGELLLRGGYLADAAKAFEQAGMKGRALTVQAELYEERKEYKKAAAIYTRMSDEERAAQMYEKIRDYRSAARHYYKARHFSRAGDLYARIKDYIPAGKAFEAAKNYQLAADCYRRADSTDKYLRCLEKGGNYYKAGEKYFELGRLDEAIAALQKVRPKHVIFKRACFLQGKVFRDKGELALAVRKLEQGIEQDPLGSGNIDMYYELAETLLEKGEDERSLRVYEQIKTVDYRYEDVSDKVNSIVQRLKIATQVPGGSETTSHLDALAPNYVLQGRYEIIEKIGKGGMGTIFKVKDTLLDRIVAYKILAADLSAHPKAFQSFLHEAKAAAQLHHSNIVTLFDIGESSGEYFLTMEYVKGMTLASLLKEKGRLPLRPSLVIVHQVCEALSYAHGRKLVHRDIKPSNIMVDDQYQCKIFDFGLAKIIVEDKSFSTDKIAGTPHYMSPEQVVGESIDYRTDIYSLGVTFYHLVTGQTPFKGKDVGYHHLHTPPVPPKDLVTDLMDEVNEIIMKCMAKDKRERYQSADALKQVIKALLR